jgi:phosphoglucosamine mutase
MGEDFAMAQFFGTDGVRGVANRDLTPDLALALGRAAGLVLAPDGGDVIVARDTRISGPMLEGALVAGLCSAGASVRLAGVLPTPAVAYLILQEGARSGAMISASHNPVADNGIKFFSDEGLKLAGEIEEKIEDLMEAPPSDFPIGADVGQATWLGDAADRYVDHLLESIETRLDGLRIVLDCAYGAAWQIAPRAFREAGAEVVAIHAEPNGALINVDCGSTSTGELGRRVITEAADLGIAFDGDADRALAVDETGRLIDGDRIIAMTALRLHGMGSLDHNIVVATVMANLSFVRALEERGITVVRAPVGDKHVAGAMAEHGAVLGGEQSGHVIFSRHSTTGDGVLTALKVAETLMSSDETMSEAANLFEPYPQVVINVEVASKDLDGAEEVWVEIRRAQDALGDDGRVLVRPSGTEPLVRVMVEAHDPDLARRTAEEVAGAVRGALG